MALVTFCNVFVLMLFVYAAARALHRADARRREAEETLRASEERMDFALEAGQVGIWDADPRAGTVVWSKIFEAIHGLPPVGARGSLRKFLECVHPEDRDATRTAIENALAVDTDSTFEYRSVWPDGSVRSIVGRGRHIRVDGSDRVVGIALDVTERKQLESQLAQAQKMEAIGQLAGGVAHDFNNQLTAILGFAEMLALEPTVSERARRDLEEIRKAAERSASLTRQLLAFSRRQILQPRILDLNVVVTDAVEMLRRLIGESIDLRLNLHGSLRAVRADPTQVEQVLMNLVVNACDAMEGGGTLTIDTANVTLDDASIRQHGIAAADASGPYTLLQVSDDGVGMDAATKKRIFEPFFTTKPPGKGTGLGLATVYGVVKQSGGFVWVYSERGQGTTVKVYLPSVDALSGQRIVTPQAAEKPSRGAETVLLVEDEDAVRRLGRSLLERSGYRVLEAASPTLAERVSAAQDGAIDLLLTDVVMPNASGPELFQRLHTTRPEMKVLYMSGYASEAIVQRGVLEPGAAFIQKPFSATSLTRKVRDVLDA